MKNVTTYYNQRDRQQEAWRCPKCGHATHLQASPTLFACAECPCELVADYSGRKVRWS